MTSVLIILISHRKTTLEQVDPLLFGTSGSVCCLDSEQRLRPVHFKHLPNWKRKKKKKDSLSYQFNTLCQTAVALTAATSFSGLKRLNFPKDPGRKIIYGGPDIQSSLNILKGSFHE